MDEWIGSVSSTSTSCTIHTYIHASYAEKAGGAQTCAKARRVCGMHFGESRIFFFCGCADCGWAVGGGGGGGWSMGAITYGRARGREGGNEVCGLSRREGMLIVYMSSYV